MTTSLDHRAGQPMGGTQAPTVEATAPDWAAIEAAASRLAPAGEWRQLLAHRLVEASGARFAAVFTCSPGNPLGAQGTVEPAEPADALQDVLQDVLLRRVLPRLERRGASSAEGPGGAVFSVLESVGDRRVVAAVRAKLLEPAGAAGLLHAFLVNSRGAVIGWLSVGTAGDGPDELARIGPALARVAQAASRTLQQAAELAAACGAFTPAPLPPGSLSSLSRRQREIVRLVADGLSDLNVASRLGISENTVGSHLRRIFTKLSVHTRVELVGLATATFAGASR